MSGQWIESLQVGDEVAIRNGHGIADYSIHRVEKLTPTQIVVNYGGDDLRFRRSNGWRIGGPTWSSISMVQATPEIRQRIEFVRAERYLRAVNWRDLSPTQVISIATDVRSLIEAARLEPAGAPGGPRDRSVSSE